MKRITGRFGLALATLALLTLSLPTVARTQGAYGDPVPLDLTVEATADPAATYSLPSDPLVVSMKLNGTGAGEPLGEVATVDQCLMQQDVYGTDVAFEMTGVITTAGGDAVYYKAQGPVQSEAATFEITGGKGKYEGATGAGVLVATPGETEGEWTLQFDGVLSTAE